MGTVMPGAKFVLNLGVDHGIAVKRRLINRLVENTGAFAKRARITYDVMLTIENNRPTAETIVVKDQIPVSQHGRSADRKVQELGCTMPVNRAPGDRR